LVIIAISTAWEIIQSTKKNIIYIFIYFLLALEFVKI